MLSVIMLSVVMMNVVMPSVAFYLLLSRVSLCCHYAECQYTEYFMLSVVILSVVAPILQWLADQRTYRGKGYKTFFFITYKWTK